MLNAHPDHQDGAEQDDEGPAAAEARQVIGQPLGQRPLLLEFLVGVLGQGLVGGDAFGDLTIELGQLAVLRQQQLLHIQGAEPRQLGQADERIRREIGTIAPDPLGQARPNRIERDQVAARPLLAGDRAYASWPAFLP